MPIFATVNITRDVLNANVWMDQNVITEISLANLFKTEIICKKGVAILDSGASTSISPFDSDFNFIEPTPSIKISGVNGSVADGKNCAYAAKFRPNNLYVKEGIYFPPLGDKRLISLNDLLNSGWHAKTSRNFSALTRTVGNYVEQRAVTWENNLPIIDFKLNGDKNSKYFYANSVQSTEFPPSPGSIWDPRRKLFESFNQIKHNIFTVCVCDCFSTESLHPENNSKDNSGDQSKISLKNLEIHQKMGHISVPGIKVSCEECLKSKGQKASHKKDRPQKYSELPPLSQLSCDFKGPIPENVRGNNYLFVAICDKTAFAFVMPIPHKDDAVEKSR